ncbi:hypothetical protein DOY81_007691 [Sarcophaga bullata]|nr:hypothetical protein DOY81_007691 [Sarcophaga bullata]
MVINKSHHNRIFLARMKYWVELYSFLCILWAQCFAVGETKIINDDIPEEIYSCDYTRFETQLERLKLQAAINHEMQLRQQKELFGNLERKVTDLSSKIERIQDKFFDFIRAESHAQVRAVTPAGDDKIVIMNGIKEKLQQQEQILNKIIDNQYASRQLIKEIDLRDHMQILKDIMSDNFESLQRMNEKLKAIEDNAIPKIHLRAENRGLSNSNQSYPTSCANFNANYCAMNKCLIKNDVYGPAPFLVACENSVDGGGWMVIQRRINGVVDFYRSWDEYKTGFGDLDGEFFIGLEKLHALTSTLKPVELLIQLQDFDNILKIAKYDDFQVDNEKANYKIIEVGSYTGDAGDSFSWHKNLNFSTKDRDNDIGDGNCAIVKNGAWWYGNCFHSNLNAKYYNEPKDISSHNGITWKTFHGFNYSLKFVQMLIRPRK